MLQPPQSFGFLGVLGRAEAPYDARVTEDLLTLELDAEALNELLEDHFSLLYASLQYLAERLLHELQELPPEAVSLAPGKEGAIPDEPLDLVERIFFLRRMNAFATANVNALAVMSAQLIEERCPKETLLWEEGSPSDCVIMLCSGRARGVTSSGKTFSYGAPCVLGGMESLAAKPHWYALYADTPLVLFRGHQEVLIDLLEENFAMASDFLAFIAQYLMTLLAKKAAAGQSTVAVPRAVSKLGTVLVGA